jgi:hypothetical protein
MPFRLLKVFFFLTLAVPLAAQELDQAEEEELESEVAEVAEKFEEKTESEIAEKKVEEADSDGSLDDATNSIDVDKILDGFGASADVRVGYFQTDIDERDGSDQSDDFVAARWRIRTEFGLLPFLRAVGRVAGICSNDECSPNLVLEDSIPTSNGMQDGDITLDEAYFHWFRLDRFDLAVGRMQTKFVARGGVFAKSLDRNDSNNVNVNWTDGLHTTFRGRSGWVPHFIMQHNSSDGPTNVRRGPLDFDDSGARVSYFLALENLERTPLFVQRGLDISYLPKTLLKDGIQSGRREDYYGFVVRTSNRWPDRNDGPRLRVAAELGYAPETQTKAAAGIAGDGDVSGTAWNVVLSLMEFKPNHSIGLNYGEVEAGWLLSPQFRQNESLVELRYQWRRSRKLAFDFRIRKRKELEQLVSADRKLEEFDFFIRFTWGGTIR